MSSPNFIYLPPDGEEPGFWLNLALPTKINEIPSTGEMLIFYQSNPHGAIYLIKGQQARHLRAALAGQTRPQLPAIPAAEQLEARLERRGVIQ